ncbi:hypothetical protein MOO45_00130 [Bombilactobacillus folatiphilus]|uniref:Uncharacterized protein n=1 Tax=Bombilactobacillus folatiphilus TaxID=2923362 RepID=A0ABY4P8U0_9LACO|nr:hypothetical protein [Bombilactobacillus folatiphilus]UQS82144.1 hypothetical protein MOO45_00130 [Bombilactobacillus folatiphilus]
MRQICGSFGTAIAMLVVSLVSNIQAVAGKNVALASGYHWSFILMLVFAILGLVASFDLHERKQG